MGGVSNATIWCIKIDWSGLTDSLLLEMAATMRVMAVNMQSYMWRDASNGINYTINGSHNASYMWRHSTTNGNRYTSIGRHSGRNGSHYRFVCNQMGGSRSGRVRPLTNSCQFWAATMQVMGGSHGINYTRFGQSLCY